jgi:hypothetical protein
LIVLAAVQDNARHDSANWMRRMIRSLPAAASVLSVAALFHPFAAQVGFRLMY